MLKKTVISMAAAAFLGGAVESQVAYADDDIWDLMNPVWWVDQIDDDDDDWRYRRYGPGPYGSPYGWGYPPGYGYPQPQPAKKKQPEIPIPE